MIVLRKFIHLGLIIAMINLLVNSFNLTVFAIPNHVNKTSPPLTKETGWSIWNLWVNFPFETIQVGLSSMDLGAMLDFEYSCFGEVGDENDILKQETYWYRISDKIEKIGTDKYIKIEVGCWLNNDFKSTIIIQGIKN